MFFILKILDKVFDKVFFLIWSLVWYLMSFLFMKPIIVSLLLIITNWIFFNPYSILPYSILLEWVLFLPFAGFMCLIHIPERKGIRALFLYSSYLSTFLFMMTFFLMQSKTNLWFDNNLWMVVKNAHIRRIIDWLETNNPELIGLIPWEKRSPWLNWTAIHNSDTFWEGYRHLFSYEYNSSDYVHTDKWIFTFGVDNISFFFVLLTTFIFPLCFFYSIHWFKYNQQSFNSIKFYLLNFFLLQFFILNVFCTLNLIVFFFFFEAILIPMLFIIGHWGPGDRKIKANYYFIFYTLAGSVSLLFSILIIYIETGTFDFEILFNLGWDNIRLELVLFFCFFISFAIKMPMFPFHIWLPEAHVEAPTAASVILAALLLKLGGYGFIRFLPLFPYAYVYFNPLLYTLGVISIIYASLVTIRQIDLKKIIAYSSVAHMNLGTVGIFSLNFQGIQGSIFLMLSHGIVSSALFFLVGMLYDRHHTKFLRYYGGLTVRMPIYSSLLLFFSLANLGFPGTSNFIGELLILIGVMEKNISIMVLTASGMLFSSVYSIWMFNRICFGNLKTQYISGFRDISLPEFKYMLPLVILTLYLGLNPNIVLNFTAYEVKVLLFTYNYAVWWY